MKLSYFISKRISSKAENSFTGTIHKIAIASIALGLAVMIISFLILGGFQKNIKTKIFSFAGHLQVSKFSTENDLSQDPISNQSNFFVNSESFDFVEHVQSYAQKAALIYAKDEILGVVLKGIDASYDTSRFNKNLVAGSSITFKEQDQFQLDSLKSRGLSPSKYALEVMVSQKIADVMEVEVGENIMIYFVDDPPRKRRVKVKGIYDTGLEEFDEKIVFCDLAMLQRINNWTYDQVGGFEVFIKDFDQLESATMKTYELVEYDQYVSKVSDRFLQNFEWLALLNRNVIIFLILILIVASFNMIAILFILIMERTPMIGTLKTLGADNANIRRIFTYNGMILIVKGLIWGNLIAIGLAYIQDRFKIIPLDPENYYMDFVPITWNWPMILFLNVLTFALVSLVLIIPTVIISKMDPIKSMKFD